MVRSSLRAMTIRVVYLVSEREHHEAFIESYRKHPSGMDHRLHYIYKHRDLRRDLDRYRRYALETPCDWLVFFNSYTVIMADNWLEKLWEPVRAGSRLVGSTSSTQSFYSNRPRLWRRLFFPPAPNWHIRTNAFLIRRDLMLRIWPKWIGFKKRAYCFESGWRSMTRLAQEAGASPIALDHLQLVRDNHICRAHER